MEIENLFNNSEILALVEEDIEKVAGGKIDVKMGATRVLATALSALSLAGGVSTHAMEPNKNSLFSFFTKKNKEKPARRYERSSDSTGIRDRKLDYMCNHFNSFEIHSDGFWKENIEPSISNSAFESLINVSTPELSTNENFKRFQSVFNDIFKGNYHFSKKILKEIADHVITCIRSRKPVTRANILLVIINSMQFSTPFRNKVFIPKPPLPSIKGNRNIFIDFPKNFLELPQVEKEFSFHNVKRKIPYDSILAYLSDLDYMYNLMWYTTFFTKEHTSVIPKEARARYSNELELPTSRLIYMDNLEEARNSFYEYLNFIKKLFGTAFLDLFESFNNYDYY